jgi:hypothetical protein
MFPSVRAGLGFRDFLDLREKTFFLHIIHGVACPLAGSSFF